MSIVTVLDTVSEVVFCRFADFSDAVAALAAATDDVPTALMMSLSLMTLLSLQMDFG